MDVKESQTEADLASVKEAEAIPTLERTPGTVLLAARERAGLSEKGVADELRITVHYVKALEQDAYDKLPGEIFAKGYIKAYATLVNEDADRLVRLYNEYCSTQQHQEKQKSESQANHSRSKRLPWILLAIFGFIAGFIGLWVFNTWFGDTDTEPDDLVQQAAATQASLSPADGNPSLLTVSERTLASPVAEDTDSGADVATLGTLENMSDADASFILGLANGGAPAEPLFDSFADAVNSMQSELAPITRSMTGNSATALSNSFVSGLATATADTATNESNVDATASTESRNATSVETIAAQTATPTPENTENPSITVAETSAGRLITVVAQGGDTMRISFAGDSWVEVDDRDENVLYRNIRRTGDTLLVSGNAPFNVLLGNASLATIELNGSAVDVSSRIRDDNTARIYVGR